MSKMTAEPLSRVRAPVVRPLSRSVDAPVDGVWTFVRSRMSRAGAPLRSRQAIAVARAAVAREQEFRDATDEVLLARRQALAALFRYKGYERAGVIEALALIRETCRRQIGLLPFLEQVAGGYALLRNAAIEMDTGEGKTLTAVFPSAIHGLAGRAVHVITSNDYLANRDGLFLKPALEALGLSVGIVVHATASEERRSAYACDVVFVSNKEVAFDYLRDRLATKAVVGDLDVHNKAKMMLSRQSGGARQIMRGLDVAIVDEIDSVLVDDAGTPLIISAEEPSRVDETTARQAFDVGAQLTAGEDFAASRHGLTVELSGRGREKIDHLTAGLGEAWKQRIRRYEMVSAAVTATHCLHRDRHYLVRDEKIILIDEFSGRTMPDRYWGHDLQHMVELKEHCPSSGQRKTLASISFQRFFRSYRDLAGMSGTVREVAIELSAVYGLSLTRIPRRLRLRMDVRGRKVLPTRTNMWQAAVSLVSELQSRGQPVLIGVRSVGEAERGSAALSGQGIAHAVLSAAHDQQEAEIVARAGQRGAVTIATNMAGRGTDIKLGEGVAELGGLVVLIGERHDARRIDRQLMGRCARQGNPGTVLEILSREDVILHHANWMLRHLAGVMHRSQWALGLPYWYGQWRIERDNARRRFELVKRDESLNRMLGFAGGLD